MKPSDVIPYFKYNISKRVMNINIAIWGKYDYITLTVDYYCATIQLSQNGFK